MNLADLQKRLIGVAQKNSLSDAVPYAFEKRIMALIAMKPIHDVLTLWSRALWRAAASCAAVMLVLGTISFLTPAASVSSSSDLSQDFENSLLVAVDQPVDMPDEIQ